MQSSTLATLERQQEALAQLASMNALGNRSSLVKDWLDRHLTHLEGRDRPSSLVLIVLISTRTPDDPAAASAAAAV